MRSTAEWQSILGTGHWEAVRELGMDVTQFFAAAEQWELALKGIALPWLCWNVDPAWCLVQQKLVAETGWTPVCGYDPRVGPPPLIEGAVCIDFNKMFGLPTLWMHFPMEFIFKFCNRLAFWHSDLLVTRQKLGILAQKFAQLPDGYCAAVQQNEGKLAFLSPKRRRYWELMGCSTKGASRNQFETGCGWWMNFWMHPSTPSDKVIERSLYYYDSGTGIRYWHKKCRGKMYLIAESMIAEGHCTRIGRADYRLASPETNERDLTIELSLNSDLTEVCRRLGIADLL